MKICAIESMWLDGCTKQWWAQRWSSWRGFRGWNTMQSGITCPKRIWVSSQDSNGSFHCAPGSTIGEQLVWFVLNSIQIHSLLLQLRQAIVPRGGSWLWDTCPTVSHLGLVPKLAFLHWFSPSGQWIHQTRGKHSRHFHEVTRWPIATFRYAEFLEKKSRKISELLQTANALLMDLGVAHRTKVMDLIQSNRDFHFQTQNEVVDLLDRVGEFTERYQIQPPSIKSIVTQKYVNNEPVRRPTANVPYFTFVRPGQSNW